jgi:hypothetical protein
MPEPRTLLKLQELGERSLPSVVAPLPAPNYGGLAAAKVAAHPLHGTGKGTYHAPQVTIDAGTSFTMSGTANVGALGSFTVSGSVRGVGMIVFGRASGELVLSNAHGTITLALHGPVQPAFSQPPAELVYSVTRGTGDFQHLSGYGTVGVQRIPAPIALGQPPTGAVTLTFT